MTQQTLYYVQFDDEYFGPFAFETIVDMSLTPEVLVLSTKTNEWKQACEYVELIDSLDLSLYEINEDESIKQQPETFEAPNSYEEFSGNSDRVSPSFNEQTIFYIRRDGNPYGPYNLEALA